MRKVCVFWVCVALLLCLISCSLAGVNPRAEVTAQADVAYIEVQYFSASEKLWKTVKIEEEETIATLTDFIAQAGGTRVDVYSILYGYPAYDITVYYTNGESLLFELLNESEYSLPLSQSSDEYTTFHFDDMSEMYAYLYEKFPDIYGT